MRTELSKRLRKIERMLPPCDKWSEHDFSLAGGVVVYKGKKIPYMDFFKLFPNARLNNLDLDLILDRFKEKALLEKVDPKPDVTIIVQEPVNKTKKVKK